MAPDMWSGWGVRTLSADNPAFNPYAYQRGAVWPHDNAIIADGFRRYGFVDEANRIAADITNASSYFALSQMPELYAGIQRKPENFPVQYLGANVPQGWAAGSCFHLLGMMVGFQPDAIRGLLYLDPALPDWMPDLTLCDLRLGDQLFDIRFWRDGPATRWDVIKGDPAKVAQHPFAGPKDRWT
jgi:glycogen debranching enzyme